MQNIFFIIPSLCNGGAERVASNLANHWSVNGNNVTIVTFAQQHKDFFELQPSIKRIELNLAYLSESSVDFMWKNIRRMMQLRKLLRHHKPDLVVSFMVEANVLLALSAYGISNIVTVGSEHTYPPNTPLGRFKEILRKYSYGQLSAVAALTKECANWIEVHTRAKHVPVLPNPVPWPMPQQQPILLPQTICNTDRKLVLAVGRLSQEKQCNVMIDVFSKLAHKYPDWDLVFIGEGPERDTLEKQVTSVGLKGRIFLPGRVGNVGTWYERADIYVMTSRYEGFPNTLAEAMAHGLPAISFDCDTGPRDIIRNGIDGILVPPRDIVAFTSALNLLMNDNKLRTQYGSCAIEARNRFSMESVVEMWEHYWFVAPQPVK